MNICNLHVKQNHSAVLGCSSNPSHVAAAQFILLNFQKHKTRTADIFAARVQSTTLIPKKLGHGVHKKKNKKTRMR